MNATTANRNTLLLGLVAAVLLGGVLLLVFANMKATDSVAAGAFLLEYEKTLERVAVAKKDGSDADYEAALTSRFIFLENNRSEFVKEFSDRIFAKDQALTLARISRIQRKRGANEDAAQSLSRAEALCPQLGWDPCSGVAILEFANRADESAR